MDSPDKLPVVIAGAGFSGLALAAQLLERGDAVVLVGLAGNFARGTAYGDAGREHLLNVPADRMGLRADAPAAFADWLGLHGDDRRRFRPRLEFGDYLLHELAALRALHGDRLRCIEAGITAISRGNDARWHIKLDCGEALEGNRLVLAVGAANTMEAAGDDGMVRQPWAAGALAGIASDAPVLVLGTGLTMIDMVLALRTKGHRGTITAISRRGRLPLLHPEPPLPPMPAPPELLAALEAGQLASAVRSFRVAMAEGLPPAALADGLRALVPRLWRGWTPATRERFLRHLRPWWDSVRHRVPREVFATLELLMTEGRLHVVAGRLLDHAGGHARIRPRGEVDDTILPVAAMIDATGIDGDRTRYASHPALAALVHNGDVRIDALGLGLDCNADGSVPGATGLHLIGFLRRGECWESTAVPELRAQAAALATELAGPPAT